MIPGGRCKSFEAAPAPADYRFGDISIPCLQREQVVRASQVRRADADHCVIYVESALQRWKPFHIAFVNDNATVNGGVISIA